MEMGELVEILKSSPGYPFAPVLIHTPDAHRMRFYDVEDAEHEVVIGDNSPEHVVVLDLSDWPTSHEFVPRYNEDAPDR